MVTSMLTYTLRRLHNFPRQIYSLKRFEVQFSLKVLGFVVLDSPSSPAPAPPRSEYGWWLPMSLTHLLKPLLCCLGAWGSNNEPKKGVNFFFLTIFKKHLPIEFHSSNKKRQNNNHNNNNKRKIFTWVSIYIVSKMFSLLTYTTFLKGFVRMCIGSKGYVSEFLFFSSRYIG